MENQVYIETGIKAEHYQGDWKKFVVSKIILNEKPCLSFSKWFSYPTNKETKWFPTRGTIIIELSDWLKDIHPTFNDIIRSYSESLSTEEKLKFGQIEDKLTDTNECKDE